MATPLSPDQFLAALRAEGCRVVEHPGWRTHTRTSSSRPWGPVHGLQIHHTVTKGTTATVRICRDGYAGLPGPLCHGVIAKDGTIHLVGYGRTNHAGGGDPDVLQAVKDESYETRPPAPNVGNADGADGNRAFYGFECENLGDGKDPWPPEQLDAIARASAAVCRAHGWTHRSVIGHLEWSDDKSDPRGFGMPWMRDKVAARLGTNPTTPKPVPEEDDMTPTQARQLAELHDALLPYMGWQYRGKGKSDAWAILNSLHAQVTGQTAAIKALAAQIGRDVDTDAVVDAVEKAIAEAVVRVDVNVTGPATS
ncbi:N-acetylmuramoyl-L-alanine amidase [Streptomyces sp. NPDC126503]|uniref:N-acetylmuramoyl-L-alanine amidase n=1 Tax=Streptomyces sp. NPDC126503 TaxID=3155315 RepID=UPI003319BD48